MADEDPDDPQLKSLRAVWLAMRDGDEDPPDSGLSALMAAARSQASMMAAAKAPWWKRMFEQLRRPPVLALASLLVVIGGAVVLTNHHDAIEKAPTTAPVQQRELPRSNLDVGGAPPPAPALAPAPAPAPTMKDQEPARVQAPVQRDPSVHTSADTGMTAPSAQTAPSSPPPTAPAFEKGDAAKAKAESAPPPSRVLVDQLAVQARKAAQRGECENAKAIATRIAGQDATYYREHVAGDLASCVPAPAAADAAH